MWGASLFYSFPQIVTTSIHTYIVRLSDGCYNPQQMSLSEQERYCVNCACEFLSSAIGGQWKVERYLDELYPEEPTPEVVVSNGETTAAIEVKRMAGDEAQQAYMQSLLSNERRLVPSCGGYYLLEPPIDLRLPLDAALRRQVIREIERVAPTLQPDDKGVILVPRSGHISFISETKPSMIFCLHDRCADLFQPLLERLEGRFMLVDEGLEHSFFTSEGKEAFCDAIASACERRLEGDSSTFYWNEEWQITRLKASAGSGEDRDGVWILASTEARSVPASINENLQLVLDNALRKFVKRWAPLHVLVLEDSIGVFTHEMYETVAGLSPDELPNIEYVLLVANDQVIECYPRLG
jgi:hypothetical protein